MSFRWALSIFAGMIMSLLFVADLSATHNRAGEISFQQIASLTIRATLTTYTKTSSVAADRDSVEIFWGDGSSEFAHRVNGWGDPQPNDVKINYYIAEHTYPARASYTISMFDPNRVGGILNVNYPDSESVPFYLETTFTFLNTQFQGENNSAILLQAPIDFGCVGEVFTHNPNAYDVDGDSLHYTLITPLQAKGSIVPDYIYPDEISSGPENSIGINPSTGDLTWDAPQVPGEFNVAILIEEYRQGTLISSMIRDMQIFIVNNCQNQPPVLELTNEICVYAGDTVRIRVKVDDPNPNQLVRLEASGAPFISTFNLASLPGGNVFKGVEYEAEFIWETSCEDISDQYYQILFKAMDNGFSDTSGLATLQTSLVKVLGPPPDSLSTMVVDNHYQLRWQYPYVCAFTEDDFFLGFSVWRSKESQFLNIDSCFHGLENRGYEIISFIHKENDGIDYFYDDFEVVAGDNYCYRVMAEFARHSFDGFPFNQVAGQPGNESCISIPVNLPYLNKSTVSKTNTDQGEIDLSWKFYSAEIFDTLAFPPPYRIALSRSTDASSFMEIPGAIYNYPFFSNEMNGSFKDKNLNTSELTYHYLIDLYYGDDQLLAGTAPDASSLFLNIESEDQRLLLDYTADVPWINVSYDVYRKGPSEQDYNLYISGLQDQSWVDSGLVNGEEYCYYVRSHGFYSFAPDESIINDSQEKCAEPDDRTPPCSPTLSVINGCDTASVDISEELLFNHLTWHFEGDSCLKLDDVAGYNIYFDEGGRDSMHLIQFIDDPEQREYDHSGLNGVQGCYAVAAIDHSQNESAWSNIVCLENCPLYQLPNVFTPNNDGTHDLFQPIVNRHVASVDMKIFNQWGQLVFETSDPLINWDGNNSNGRQLAEGVYHYVCLLPFNTDTGNDDSKQLSGFIHLIRGN